MAVQPELIAAAQGGDRMAIALLLERAQPDIRRYAKYNCRTASDVDEAVQEVLILAYRKIASLRAVGAFSGWLLSVVRRTCWRLARAVGGSALPPTALSDSGRLATVNDDQLRLDLANAIQSLPEHYRQIVLMRDVDELTIDEIAQELSLSREAVKGRLHRARGLIREYLTGQQSRCTPNCSANGTRCWLRGREATNGGYCRLDVMTSRHIEVARPGR
jgi:RNA polymerase sigma-70 factor (ECF subfamily)